MEQGSSAGQGCRSGSGKSSRGNQRPLAALLKVFAQGFAAQVRVSNQGHLAACATSLGATWSPKPWCYMVTKAGLQERDD